MRCWTAKGIGSRSPGFPMLDGPVGNAEKAGKLDLGQAELEANFFGFRWSRIEEGGCGRRADFHCSGCSRNAWPYCLYRVAQPARVKAHLVNRAGQA